MTAFSVSAQDPLAPARGMALAIKLALAFWLALAASVLAWWWN